MPKFVGECGDLLLRGFVLGSFGVAFPPGPLVLPFRKQVSLIGVLKSLSGAFMSGQVILLTMVLSAGLMGAGSKITVLSCYLL